MPNPLTITNRPTIVPSLIEIGYFARPVTHLPASVIAGSNWLWDAALCKEEQAIIQACAAIGARRIDHYGPPSHYVNPHVGAHVGTRVWHVDNNSVSGSTIPQNPAQQTVMCILGIEGATPALHGTDFLITREPERVFHSEVGVVYWAKKPLIHRSPSGADHERRVLLRWHF